MADVPRPLLSVHGEDVDVEIPGRLRIRATFLSEGLFDASGSGAGSEDLYEVEVVHLRDALLEPLVFPRLLPASSREWEEYGEDLDAPAALPAEQFLLVLAWELHSAHPSNWPGVCHAAQGWDEWMIQDGIERLPPDWVPELELPDED